MLERKFQAQLIKEIKEMLPGCVVLKNDPNYIQGFPDLLILYGKHWAALEVKSHGGAIIQPNQTIWIDKLRRYGFASFIFPENKEKVFKKMCEYFEIEPPKNEEYPLVNMFEEMINAVRSDGQGETN